MKILAVDWGTKIIGLAISDSGVFARQLPEIPRDQAIVMLTDLVKKEAVEKVVIGIPTAPDGSIGRQAQQVYSFGDELTKAVLAPIEYEDEAFTSNEAKRLGGLASPARKRASRSGSHSLEARLILEQYLTRAKQ